MPDKSDSFSGKFLARKTELILARYLPQSEVLEKLAPDPMDLPVRILIVSAHPERSDGRNLETIEDDDFISQLLMLKSDSIKIEHLVDPNYETLKEFIKGKNGDQGFVPHILHFIGHGEAGKIALKKTRKDIIEELNRAGKISIVDPDSADDAEWIDKKGISSLFDDVSKPKFVFLNACNAAKTEFRGYNDFSNNLAIELVNSGIPAVLAMQYKITNDDAAEFSQRIYLDIRKGVPIDQAVKNGIRILGDRSPAWNHPRFGIPVFYLGAKDTTFLSVAEPEIEVKQDMDERLIIECLNPRCGKTFNSKFDSCPYCLTGYMLCVHCKKQLPVDANYCPYCKKPQGKGKISASQEKKVSQSGEAKTPVVLEKSSTSVSADSSNANIWPSKN
jgi:hypothetical protein